MLTARRLIIVVFAAIVSLSLTKESYAYGGGGGTSGYIPTPDVKFVCTYETKTFKLPYNDNFEFKFPKCSVEITKKNDVNFKGRVSSFINRVSTGKN